jgi:hypothetical protein
MLGWQELPLMDKDVIRKQIEAMPGGDKRELALCMYTAYESEFGEWDDEIALLDLPIWDSHSVYSVGASIPTSTHKELDRLAKKAGGWFYTKNEELVFVTPEEWEEIESGRKARYDLGCLIVRRLSVGFRQVRLWKF